MNWIEVSRPGKARRIRQARIEVAHKARSHRNPSTFVYIRMGVRKYVSSHLPIEGLRRNNIQIRSCLCPDPPEYVFQSPAVTVVLAL